MRADELKGLTDWLARQGAEVLAPTNPYELARFRANGGVHVIYTNARGQVSTSPGFAGEAIVAFKAKRSLDMGISTHTRTNSTRKKDALLIRDGRDCFYCGRPMNDEDVTIEHLVSIDKGGPNHMDNLALCHEQCNKRADNLPLVKKIAMYCKARNT